ncbi:MAG: flavin prenyltransferase UbiX [Pseudomonadota bacterium]|nr:flavin prenyltransferase UbiX [Pseudomonadota bacterium]
MHTRNTISLAMTGASGAQYGLRLLECMLQAGRRVYLMISAPGQVVIGMETEFKLPGRPVEIQRVLSERYGANQGQLQVFGREEWTAPVASGSSPPDAMVICPCTMGTLSAVAGGASKNLIERAADVILKEGRKLVIVPRETPFSAIHLENMLRLARLGVSVLPANPGFYHKPAGINDLVDFVVARILDQLGVDHEISHRWGAAGYPD